MAGQNLGQKLRGTRSEPTARRPLLAALLASAFAVPAFTGAAQAQEAWRGLSVPRYHNATDFDVKTDDDEYEIYFRSQDGVQAVFDFYRSFLERQGFRVTDSRTKSRGLKADMVRGQGGPADTVELDAKLKQGRYKVEIEFDE